MTFALSSCTDTKNQKEKKSKEQSVNSITLQFSTKTTTENGVTSQTIEPLVLDMYTKSISDIFSKGSRVPALFTTSIFDQAKPIFEPSLKATDEKVSVDLNVLKSTLPTDNLAVAHIKQSKVESGKTLERSGIIYFDSAGLVTGYKLDIFADPAAASTQPNSSKVST